MPFQLSSAPTEIDVRALAAPHSASSPFFSIVLDQGQIGLKARKLRC